MKAILEFDLNEPDDDRHHKMCVDARDMSVFLWDVEQQVFRPARKHGYEASTIGKRLNELLDTNGGVVEAIGLLEDLYFNLKSGRFDYE
jgi:hypothetical protein